MARKFDLIVFGATGFTGRLAADYLSRNYGPPGAQLKYAFAGRSQEKLEDVKAQLSALGNPYVKDVELVIASTDDEKSIADMCAAAQVIVSTVGPYGKYGEVVVRSCVKAETHYCDITGELHWIRSMIDKYHEDALHKKVKIVNCCGFDCVPCDLGTYLLQKHAKEEMGTTLEKVNFRTVDTKGGVSGGTIASLFDLLSLPKPLLTQMNDPYFLCGNGSPTELAKVRQPNPKAVIFDDILEKYTAPHVMELIDSRVVRRSNFLLNYEYGESFQYHEAASFSRYWLLAKCSTVAMSVVERLLGFTVVRTLLRKVLPKPGEGPSVKTRESGYFWCRLFGECADSGQGRRMIAATVGSDKGDPGYNETAKMLIESALCLILSSAATPNEIPKSYGVLTPSVAFGLALVKRLNSAGMTFKIDSSSNGEKVGKS